MNGLQNPRTFQQSLLAILGICFVTMMVALDQTVVGTALPLVVAELNGFSLYAWGATSYLLTTVITVPIFGRLGDYYGRKYLVVASIIVFTLASALCGLANSMLFLVLARALQGVGGGMLMGTAFACIPDLFPDARTRLRWQVLLSTSFGIANALGPSLGGWLTESYGWRSVFFVNLPVGVMSLWFVWRHLPYIRHSEPNSAIKLDWPGAALIAICLGSLQLIVEMLPKHGLDSTLLALIAAGIGSFITLIWWEPRCAHPILPPAMFRQPGLAALFELSAWSGFAIFVLMVYAPLMLQGGFALSPQETGLLITPMVVSITISSIINSHLVSRVSRPTLMLYAGFGLIGLSVTGILFTTPATPHLLIAGYLLLSGLGVGFVMPNVHIFTQEIVGRAQLGIATALVQSLRMVGGMLGTALVGSLVNDSYSSKVQQALEGGNAVNWSADLQDPQLLISRVDLIHFLSLVHNAGLDGHALITMARSALVSSVHLGLVILLAVVLFALWRIRRVPQIKLSRSSKPQMAEGE